MAKYPSPQRCKREDQQRIQEILTQSENRHADSWADEPDTPPYPVQRCTMSDANEMSTIYRRVFKTYPFPIYDPRYLSDMMCGHIHYYHIRENDQIIALAASEMDKENLGVEMTDFATLHDWRGEGLALRLLETMEKEMSRMGMQTAFTIARALSPAMNKVFGKMGYLYGGTLWNNTNISGQIESMNVWYKRIISP